MSRLPRTACFCIALAVCLFPVGAQSNSPPPDRMLFARMQDSSGAAAGLVAVTAAAKGGVLVSVDLHGLPPGWRALHIHGRGDCSDHADHFMKAGGHAAAEGQAHGFLNPDGPHAGDLPNIWVNADGTAKAQFYSNLITFDALTDEDGSAFMVHAEADDYRSQPAGNAGTRLSCGVIDAK
jgi:Cu-Zn family superoxide dismutase